MGGRTSIGWTNMSWNPVSGCSKVSQGCKFCYAERCFPRAYPGRVFTDVRCHPERLKQPMTWHGGAKIFVNSMSDLFHETVPFAFIDRVFGVMAACPQHTFQILTKRPERMREYFSTNRSYLWAYNAAQQIHELAGGDCARITKETTRRFPNGLPDRTLANAWLGVSVEDQETAQERIPILLGVPAALRFLSCEPLLGPLDLAYLDADFVVPIPGRPAFNALSVRIDERPGISWVIVGGESGPKARPFNIEWARSLVRQCADKRVACFVKQFGAKPFLKRMSSSSTSGPGFSLSIVEASIDTDIVLKDRKGEDTSEWPPDLRVQEWPNVGVR